MKYSLIILNRAKTKLSGKPVIKKSNFAVFFFFGFIIVSICNYLNQHYNCETKPESPIKIGICDGNPKTKKKLKTLQI